MFEVGRSSKQGSIGRVVQLGSALGGFERQVSRSSQAAAAPLRRPAGRDTRQWPPQDGCSDAWHSAVLVIPVRGSVFHERGSKRLSRLFPRVEVTAFRSDVGSLAQEVTALTLRSARAG